MHDFKVWAPCAKRVTLKLSAENRDAIDIPMQGPDERGVWRQEVAEAEAGMDYGYCIDDDPRTYPDPRSLWQPNGVHGLSRIYHQDAFAWSDSEFNATALEKGVMYELHVGTFTPEGTLDSAISRLDHLVSLGVTHVELMPVAAFSGARGWGYDGVCLFAVQEAYGGPNALKRFANAAHQKGLAVVLDVVYNHFGPVGNYVGKFGPYVLDAHRTPWGCAVNLEDAGSHEVRRFFCDNALMWLKEFHMDGLRLDAVHALVDRSAIHFLEQLATEVEVSAKEQCRRLVLIAESDLNDPRVVMSLERGGMGFDAQWSDDFHHALFTVLNPGPPRGYYADFGQMKHLAKALEKTFVYDGIYSAYRDRHHGRPTGNIAQNRFLGFIQNHDQVGNRVMGDRINEIVGLERAKIAAAVVLASPFIPMIFQGEEWAASSPFQYFADHEDPEMIRLVTEGRQQEFISLGWESSEVPDPEDRATFDRSKLNWDEVNREHHAEMLAWYRSLIQLRRSNRSFQDSSPGSTDVAFSENQRWFTVTRGTVMLLCNLGKCETSLPVGDRQRILMASRANVSIANGALSLPTDTVAIVE